jgi:23S rRNA (uracil1939-C5)-methyltransferase
VFVEDLLPEETATIKIHAKKSTYKRATVVHRENESVIRGKPPCPYYAACGGCQLQHLKEDKQVDIKVQWFFETLKRIGKWDSEDIKKTEKNFSVVYLKQSHYRRRIRLHFDGKDLGFHQRESHQIVSIKSCYLARPLINEKITFIKSKLPALYPELLKIASVSQLEFDVELTESDEEKIIINVVNFQTKFSNLKEEILQQLKVELLKNFGTAEDQLIHMKHPMLGRFKFKKESFVQPHYRVIDSYFQNITNCVHSFYEKFLKSISQSKQSSKTLPMPFYAWDLYSGSGIFSCIPYFIGLKFNITVQTTAVEGVQEAIDSLMVNYKNIPVDGVVQDVSDFIDDKFNSVRTEGGQANIIILDPPRSGVGIPNMQKLVEVCAHEACVLYLACDPASYARDTQILLEGGFQNHQTILFDAFGQTNFYEVLGFFTRGV